MQVQLSSCLDVVRDRIGDFQPRIGIVLGSGLGALGMQIPARVEIDYRDLPDFPRSTVPGHSGTLIVGNLAETPVALLSGRSHYYEHGNAAAMRLPIALLQTLGCETLVLSNAAGSTRPDLVPGTLMLIADHINWSGVNPLIGMTGDSGFVDLSAAYSPALQDLMREAASRHGILLAEGVYAWFSGPSYETPAEISVARKLGADAIGMSTVPETILARSMGLQVVAVSLITNLGAGIGDEKLDHAEVKREAAKAGQQFETLVREFLRQHADRHPNGC